MSKKRKARSKPAWYSMNIKKLIGLCFLIVVTFSLPFVILVVLPRLRTDNHRRFIRAENIKASPIQVWLFKEPLFIEGIRVEVQKDECLDLRDTELNGTVRSILINGEDTGEVLNREDAWECRFFRNVDCRGEDPKPVHKAFQILKQNNDHWRDRRKHRNWNNNNDDPWDSDDEEGKNKQWNDDSGRKRNEHHRNKKSKMWVKYEIWRSKEKHHWGGLTSENEDEVLIVKDGINNLGVEWRDDVRSVRCGLGKWEMKLYWESYPEEKEDED